MHQLKALTRSILVTTGCFFVFHTLVFAALLLGYHMATAYLVWFLASSFVLHVILALVLLRGRKDFFNLETGVLLEKVNIPTLLTMFRITSLPSLMVLLFCSQVYRPVIYYLLAYTALAFISDMLDGHVSRSTHQCTRVGQYLDSMSDYAVLLGVAIAFAWFGLVSPWFFVAALVRFFTQWAMAGLLFLLRGGDLEPKSSWLGKASVAGTMVVFGLYLLKLFAWFDPWRAWLLLPELLCLAVLVLSLGEKILLFVRELSRIRTERSSPTETQAGLTPPPPAQH